MGEKKGKVVFVKGSTATKGLATYIFASAITDNKEYVKLRGIGAGANNQMTKAIIIAKEKLAGKGVSIEIDIYFKDIQPIDITGKIITGIEYLIKFNR